MNFNEVLWVVWFLLIIISCLWYVDLGVSDWWFYKILFDNKYCIWVYLREGKDLLRYI